MTLSYSMLLIIAGSCIVTLLPRIIPFIVIKNFTLPTVLMKWLSYIPICILTALVVEHIWIVEEGSRLRIDLPFIIALIPTAIAAVWSRSLSITVLTGVICMAIIRYFA